MLAGDSIGLNIRCGSRSVLFLSSQSNRKIFKPVSGAVAEQSVSGILRNQATVTVFPDPVVLQEESRHRQLQHWDVAPDALLFAVD